MTTDLWCLVVNALWGYVLVLVEVAGKTRTAGTQWNAGNRADEPKFPAWVERTSRSLSNHKENFPLFLTAVVVVHLVGRPTTSAPSPRWSTSPRASPTRFSTSAA